MRLYFFAMHARSTLFTMFGDFVHPRGDVVWVGTIIEWMRVMGFSEQAVRAAVSRSSRTGWLSVERVGRKSYYALTPDVRWRIHRAVARLYAPLEQPWDEHWRVLVYSIPEELRQSRDRFRKELSVLGFGQFAAGVWVSPNDLGQAALALANDHGLGAHVEMLEAKRLSLSPNSELVAKAWDFEDLNARYAQFLENFSKTQNPASDEEAFRAFVEILHAYRKFLFSDPGLPSVLQPKGYLGVEAAKLFRARRAKLEPMFSRFVERTFQAP